MNVFHYGIYQVKYDSDHKHIVEVKLKGLSPASVQLGVTALREEIVNALKNRTRFVTIPSDGREGEPVEIYPLGLLEYIRTKPDRELRDNLGELPEY